MKTWSDYNDFILKEATNDLSESQPQQQVILLAVLLQLKKKLLVIFKKLDR